MPKRFLECSLDQPYLLPPGLQDWLPERHLARFVGEVTEPLDLSALCAVYERECRFRIPIALAYDAKGDFIA